MFPAQKSLTSAIAAGLFLCAAPVLFGQQYPFLPVPGAPKNVRTLFQDSLGRLWVGGDQLACFDGTRLFSLADYGLPAGQTYSVAEDSSGAIWIGAGNGLYRFSRGQVEAVSSGVFVAIAAATPDVIVAAMGPAGKGVPVEAALARISRAGSQWKTERIEDMAGTGLFTSDHSGHFLYPYPGGWKEFTGEDVIRWHSGAQFSEIFHRVPGFDPNQPAAGPTRTLRDRYGCIWVGSESQDLYSCAGDQFVQPPFPSLRSTLSEAPDGSMVLIGYNVLAVGRPGHYLVARAANGLPVTFSALEAVDGTIWVGGAEGLYRFPNPFRMEYWTARDGIDNPWAVQRAGEQIYAGLDHAVGVLDGSRHHWQTLPKFPTNIGQVVNLLPMPDGNLLVALNPGGVVVARPDGTVEASSLLTSGAYGLRLAATPKGEIWMGGIGLGQVQRDGSRLTFANHYLQTQPAGNVLDVQSESHSEQVWACYNGGLTHRGADGNWREITTKDGLLVDACWSLAALPDGDVWYGYYNTPAFAQLHPVGDGRYAVRQFREGGEIRDAESLNLDVDRRGWLWRGGNKGISVADEANAKEGRWLFLDQSDGLSGVGANTGSFFADRDGSVWMGIDMSIFHYKPPEDLMTPSSAPRIFVSAYSWNGGAPRLAESVDAVPHGANVVAHIGSLQFDRRNAMALRYRIPPEARWQESRSFDLPLGALPSGAHSLEVQARVLAGPWSPILERSFVVMVPVWRSTRLLLLYAFAATLLALGVYFWYRRRAAEEANLLPDLAGLRARALLPEVSELAGAVLDDRFELRDLLARGGFANVMDGYDRRQRKRCAVKIFRSEVGDAEWIQERFHQEVAALQQVRHSNVVSIYAHGSTPSGAPYLVMEFLEGRTLRAVLEGGPMASWRAARLLRQIASALDAIHGQGICHRDVKPENIVVRREGTAQEESVLIDFSIAIVKDANETLCGLSRAAGSFDYMAPEQAIGYAEASTDIYSLAKVAVEVLTGRRLSQLLPAAALDLGVRTRELLKTLEVNLSDETVDLLAGALEFDPARRPHVAGCFVNPLARDLESDASRPVS